MKKVITKFYGHNFYRYSFYRYLNLFLACGFFAVPSLLRAQTNQENFSVQRLSLNDVSVLLPLPAVGSWSDLPAPHDGSDLGPLLPKSYITEHIPTLLQFTDNSVIYDRVRLLGIRFDPCFSEGLAPECHRQIRLIWQPLEEVSDSNGKKTSTADVTLHSFYEMAPEEFAILLAKLRDLKSRYSPDDINAPLAMHPVIKSQGLKGPYFQELKKIIFTHAGQKNLTRITFMSLFGRRTVWFFGGINISSDGQPVKITIPRITTTLQQFINTSVPVGSPNQFEGRIFPAPAGQNGFNDILRNSNSFTRDREEDIRSSAKLAFEFENPLTHNPGTLDCVSCHAAQQTKNWIFRNWDFMSEDDYRSVRYNSEYNLKNVSPLQNNTAVVRIFGYFNDKPFAAQRVINESAQVLKFLDQ